MKITGNWRKRSLPWLKRLTAIKKEKQQHWFEQQSYPGRAGEWAPKHHHNTGRMLSDTIEELGDVLLVIIMNCKKYMSVQFKPSNLRHLEIEGARPEVYPTSTRSASCKQGRDCNWFTQVKPSRWTCGKASHSPNLYKLKQRNRNKSTISEVGYFQRTSEWQRHVNMPTRMDNNTVQLTEPHLDLDWILFSLQSPHCPTVERVSGCEWGPR